MLSVCVDEFALSYSANFEVTVLKERPITASKGVRAYVRGDPSSFTTSSRWLPLPILCVTACKERGERSSVVSSTHHTGAKRKRCVLKRSRTPWPCVVCWQNCLIVSAARQSPSPNSAALPSSSSARPVSQPLPCLAVSLRSAGCHS